jgi:hypothetical protein
MSRTAIFPGSYQEVRSYAELLDKVLVELKGGAWQPQDEKRKRLARFLTELGSANTRSLTARMISRLLRNEGRVTPQELANIGGKLNAPDAITIPPPRHAITVETNQRFQKSFEV